MIATLAQLQAHLRLPVGADSPLTTAEADLQLKLEQAQALILDYIARPADEAWTAEIASWISGSPIVAAPPQVQAAILMQAAELYRFRGDDLEAPADRQVGDLSPAIKTMLYRFKDPAIA